MSKFRFCPKCGGELEYKKFETAEHPQCTECGFIFYINAKAATGAFVVNKQGEILLARRNIEPSRGKWDFLGGFVEAKEHPVDGLKREVKEEIGVDIEVGDFLGFFMDVYHHGNIAGQYVMNIFYFCTIQNKKFILDKEISELKWFAKDEIPWEELAFKNTKDAMNYYLDVYESKAKT